MGPTFHYGPFMAEGDEGEVWQHKVIHGYRWYKIRLVVRANPHEVIQLLVRLSG